MCTVLKKLFPKKGRIAKEKIRVWKVLVMDPYNEDLFITPFARNKVMADKPIIPAESSVCIVDRKVIWGAIFAWQDTEKGVQATLNMVRMHFEVGELKIIAECAIPAGTRYWLGNHDDICAKRMDIVNIACKTFKSAGVTEHKLGVNRMYSYENEWFDKTTKEIRNRKLKKLCA